LFAYCIPVRVGKEPFASVDRDGLSVYASRATPLAGVRTDATDHADEGYPGPNQRVTLFVIAIHSQLKVVWNVDACRAGLLAGGEFHGRSQTTVQRSYQEHEQRRADKEEIPVGESLPSRKNEAEGKGYQQGERNTRSPTAHVDLTQPSRKGRQDRGAPPIFPNFGDFPQQSVAAPQSSPTTATPKRVTLVLYAAEAAIPVPFHSAWRLPLLDESVRIVIVYALEIFCLD
jgi:hypothetical protein